MLIALNYFLIRCHSHMKEYYHKISCHSFTNNFDLILFCQCGAVLKMPDAVILTILCPLKQWVMVTMFDTGYLIFKRPLLHMLHAAFYIIMTHVSAVINFFQWCKDKSVQEFLIESTLRHDWQARQDFRGSSLWLQILQFPHQCCGSSGHAL